MKIYNYASINCDRELWHDIAKALELNGKLREAELLDRYELTVVVKKGISRNNDERLNFGDYTLGRITIYPCKKCTEGTILFTYLHELSHAWLYENLEDYYFEEWTEDFCEKFTENVFSVLGGKLSNENNCEKYIYPSKLNTVDLEDIIKDILKTTLNVFQPGRLG